MGLTGDATIDAPRWILSGSRWYWCRSALAIDANGFLKTIFAFRPLVAPNGYFAFGKRKSARATRFLKNAVVFARPSAFPIYAHCARRTHGWRLPERAGHTRPAYFIMRFICAALFCRHTISRTYGHTDSVFACGIRSAIDRRGVVIAPLGGIQGTDLDRLHISAPGASFFTGYATVAFANRIFTMLTCAA